MTRARRRGRLPGMSEYVWLDDQRYRAPKGKPAVRALLTALGFERQPSPPADDGLYPPPAHVLLRTDEGDELYLLKGYAMQALIGVGFEPVDDPEAADG